MIDLHGKRALVCGSTQGIGRACAVALARQGAEVILLARDEDRLIATRDGLPPCDAHPEHRASHHYLVADFEDAERVGDVVTSYLASADPVHILVNNTGGPPGGTMATAEGREFEAAFRSHLMANHYLAQAVLPGMRDAGYGRIINIVSTSVKQPIRGLGVSNTVRGAVASWAKTLAGEVGSWGVTVNNVLPGATLTARHHALVGAKARRLGVTEAEIERAMLEEIPLGRFATPEEIAAAVAFLASPAGGYISGINLPVDGGRTSSL